MTTTLTLAPAASGKTAYLVDQARRGAVSPGEVATPRVIVPTRLQARAWRERLARAGGALGVRVGTFGCCGHGILPQPGCLGFEPR